MKYILAISGGVDSVVLLDMIANNCCENFSLVTEKNKLTVAHFDHGIRGESKRDAEFVRDLANKYSLPFVLGEGRLGLNASEESARKARYAFFHSIFTRSDPVKIITAHHQDDLIETIVINILRGTGWRGLAPFWSDDIIRPLINMNKSEIVRYAIEHDLEWVEDETNYQSKYFRNRVRAALSCITKNQREDLTRQYCKQCSVRAEIENILQSVPNFTGSDLVKIEQLTKMNEEVGVEVLNKMTNGELTSPQLKRLLKFLRTANTGDICQPGGGMQITMQRDKIITRTNLKK